MLWGGVAEPGALELRRMNDGGARLTGRFPYNRNAVLSDGGRTGRPRKERIAPRAFAYRIEDPKEDIHLLVGHDYGKPLASKAAGTLSFVDTAAALVLNAVITRQVAETTHGRDALAMIGAGLAVGLSPGFRIPPERAVPQAEVIEEEPDTGELDEDGQPMRGAIIRVILAALLYELSLVTRPAYPEAQIEARNWQPNPKGLIVPEAPDAGLRRTFERWRA